MELGSLLLAVSLLCSLPAGLVLVGVIANRPAGNAWLRRRAPLLAWLAAIGWGGIAVRNWVAPGDFPVLAVVVPAIAMVCTVAFALARFGGGSLRS
jgi:hypothetical protein